MIIKLIGIKGYIKQRLIMVSFRLFTIYTSLKIDDVLISLPGADIHDSFKKAEYARNIVRNTYHSKKLGWLISLLDHDREQYFIEGYCYN